MANALDQLRIHVLNVDHGDAVILELPDYNSQAHFGIVDTGRPEKAYRRRLSQYLDTLVDVRGLADNEYSIDFVCVTHPHEDHYGGLSKLLDAFASHTRHKIHHFWDCGFRTTAKTYNELLSRIARDDRIVYARLASGFEQEFGDVRVVALAPSLDLRNRFDTYGVDRNNASIVLKVMFKKSAVVLAGDAFFDSWGKVVEEFPRMSKVTFFKDASPDRSEGTNQLNCQLLKVSHHGSKHGTSLEYLEKLTPSFFAITCALPKWYTDHKPGWGTSWPHPLTIDAIREAKASADIKTSASHGNLVYHLDGSSRVKRVVPFAALPGDPQFRNDLKAAL